MTAPGFGDTFTVEWLDANKLSLGIYFAALANNATGWGYTRNKDMRGAPYDFRKAPSTYHPMQPFNSKDQSVTPESLLCIAYRRLKMSLVYISLNT